MHRILVVLSLLFAFCLMAVAHGKEKHVMGTVTNVSENSITVETARKKSVTVQLTENTKFEKNGTPATLQDLKVGDRVVIHADVSDKRLLANEVHFGAMKAKQPMKGMEGMDHK